MKQYIMSITAQDHSGLVAGVSQAAVSLGGNIEAASQTVHQGYFSMMVLYSFPDEVSRDEIHAGITEQVGNDLHVFISDYTASKLPKMSGSQSFIITSIGPDKPGILQALSEYLSSKEINIDDLYAVVEQGSFVVICQVSVPGDTDVYMLQSDLESVGRTLGVEIQMQHEDIFVATNELSLRRRIG